MLEPIIHCKFDSLLDPKDLKPYQRNRNKHPESQLKRLAKAYEFHGIRHPIIIDKDRNVIAAGHGRRLAALKAGIKQFPVVYQEFKTEEDLYTFCQADNASTIESELDLSGINADLADIGPFDIDKLLIPNFEIEPMDKYQDKDADALPENVAAVCKPGQIWKLGEHRLMCGDSTSINDYNKLMGGAKPLLMVTDPPYGVNYEAGWRAKAKGVTATEREETSSLVNDDRSDWFDAYNISNADVAYVWHASVFTDVVMDGLKRSGFKIKQQIIWNKNVHALSGSDYHWKHEPCWYAVKEDSHWNGDRTQMTVWDVKNVMFEKDKTDHPTQKPVQLFEIPYNNNSSAGDLVYDPFTGSGSSLIAAEKTNRIFYGMELDPKFCDTIISRWENFSGKKSELL